MIHVLSAHYRSTRWMEIQLRCLEAFIERPFRLIWSIEAISDHEIPAHQPSLTIVSQPGDHAQKLNAMAELAMADASQDDLLVFLDGDAFPVAELADVFELATSGRIVAVRRDENDGDPQPHPCFCVVPVRQWRAIGGDWAPGPDWTTRTGAAVTDVGARLWARMRRQGIGWTPLLRTLDHDLHALWFGVYGDVVYHHGAAFRFPWSRADTARSANATEPESQCELSLERIGRHSEAIGERVYARLAHLEPRSILSQCRDGSLFAGLTAPENGVKAARARPGRNRPVRLDR